MSDFGSSLPAVSASEQEDGTMSTKTHQGGEHHETAARRDKLAPVENVPVPERRVRSRPGAVELSALPCSAAYCGGFTSL